MATLTKRGDYWQAKIRRKGYRMTRGIGTELGGKVYRGLLPHQPVIYSSRGDGLSQNTKRRVLETGELREYKACDAPGPPDKALQEGGDHWRLKP